MNNQNLQAIANEMRKIAKKCDMVKHELRVTSYQLKA